MRFQGCSPVRRCLSKYSHIDFVCLCVCFHAYWCQIHNYIVVVFINMMINFISVGSQKNNLGQRQLSFRFDFNTIFFFKHFYWIRSQIKWKKIKCKKNLIRFWIKRYRWPTFSRKISTEKIMNLTQILFTLPMEKTWISHFIWPTNSLINRKINRTHW